MWPFILSDPSQTWPVGPASYCYHMIQLNCRSYLSHALRSLFALLMHTSCRSVIICSVTMQHGTQNQHCCFHRYQRSPRRLHAEEMSQSWRCWPPPGESDNKGQGVQSFVGLDGNVHSSISMYILMWILWCWLYNHGHDQKHSTCCWYTTCTESLTLVKAINSRVRPKDAQRLSYAKRIIISTQELSCAH